MGGRSKSKSGGVQADTSRQMRANEKHKVGNDTMLGILEQLQGGQLSSILPIFGGMVGGGLSMFNQNPNMPQQMDLSVFQPQQPQQAPQAPQMSPYEQQIQYLMADKGMTRQQAIQNQRNAMQLGTDYNNDGAVTGDEWAKFGQTQAGAAYRNKHEGRPMPSQGMPQQLGFPMPSPRGRHTFGGIK